MGLRLFNASRKRKASPSIPGVYLQTTLSVLKNRFNLVAGNAGKPSEKIIDAGSAFQVLEERFYWNASPMKNPCAADFVWISFYGGAR